MKVFARTRERERSWKLGAACLGVAVILAPIITPMFEGKSTTFRKILWSFSEILESVCVLPQLLLLRQTKVPTVIDSFYLLTLGSYRAFYILNWIERALDADDHPPKLHPVSIIFGIIQTALYVDFAWVYWTRQRVKLRGGGVVDSDDLGKSWLLRRVLGRQSSSMDEEERPALAGDEDEASRGPTKTGGRWGARGISVSADEGVLDQVDGAVKTSTSDHSLEGVADDDRNGFSPGGDSAHSSPRVSPISSGVKGGQEWRDN
ncbi:MAG: hypothetical protein M1825_002864 [Sarcosagium campestre]|nr:MAG: hypothetical protein M1825_002864 [Sarcosagium campestre]